MHWFTTLPVWGKAAVVYGSIVLAGMSYFMYEARRADERPGDDY